VLLEALLDVELALAENEPPPPPPVNEPAPPPPQAVVEPAPQPPAAQAVPLRLSSLELAAQLAAAVARENEDALKLRVEEALAPVHERAAAAEAESERLGGQNASLQELLGQRAATLAEVEEAYEREREGRAAEKAENACKRAAVEQALAKERAKVQLLRAEKAGLESKHQRVEAARIASAELASAFAAQEAAARAAGDAQAAALAADRKKAADHKARREGGQIESLLELVRAKGAALAELQPRVLRLEAELRQLRARLAEVEAALAESEAAREEAAASCDGARREVQRLEAAAAGAIAAAAAEADYGAAMGTALRGVKAGIEELIRDHTRHTDAMKRARERRGEAAEEGAAEEGPEEEGPEAVVAKELFQ